MSEKHIYERGRVGYRLGGESEKIRSVVKVEGLLKGTRYVFKPGPDYLVSKGVLTWSRGGARPDERTPFYVNYTFGEPSGITDANPGSVVRTIVEAISREIEYLYLQMDFVYRSGFVDTATGNSLDLVVALLGITRTPAQLAQGEATFGRKTPPPEVAVSSEVSLFDGRDQYELKHLPVKEIQTVKGLIGKKPVEFQKGTDYVLSQDGVRWMPGGKKPDPLSEFSVDYKAFQQILVPSATRISTFTRRPEDARMFETAAEGTMVRTTEGTWEATVPVRALVAGPEGNVLSGSITLMPQPIEGAEFVINRIALTGGSEPEGDEELRERAKRELRALGRATYTSLKQQIESVEGVVRPIKIEEMPVPFAVEKDGKVVQLPVPGVVRIIVDGGDEAAIRRVIDETRAAGVYVELLRPKLVLLDATVLVHRESDSPPIEVLQDATKAALQQYITSIQAGDTVIYARMLSTVMDVTGVRDLESLTAQAYREGQALITSTKENIVLEENEKVRLRNVVVQEAGAS